jgi:peptide/nickel transport system ATP-binding protein
VTDASLAAPGLLCASSDEPILEVRDLRTYFFTDDGVVKAVDGVSFDVRAGESVAIVGESGSGKSVTGMSIMKLLDEPGRIAGGEIIFRGRSVVALNSREIRSLRGGSISMVFQDPLTSLNPVLRIGRQMIEGMLVHRRQTKAVARKHAVHLLGRMGIPEPAQALNSYPHQFSGGMRQRVMIAIGYGNDPTLLIADEPTTALDVTIQSEILDLLRELNSESGAAILMITHDLGVVASLCTRAIVMYAGEVVESGTVEQLLSAPKHPYTWSLLNAVPRIDRDRPQNRQLTVIEGHPPDPKAFPEGCRFAPRCPFRFGKCNEHPALAEIGLGHKSACWLTQSGSDLPSARQPGCSSRPKAARRTEFTTSAAARTAAAPSAQNVEAILEVQNLVKHFPVGSSGLFTPRDVVRAVDDVDLVIAAGETVGLVGESGSGKSTVARLITRLIEPTSGQIHFQGKDITTLNASEMQPIRRRMQMIFQNPYASLNPRMTVGEAIAEALKFHGLANGPTEIRFKTEEALAKVGLSGDKILDRYPHEFSGGQRQRIGIARSLVVEPRFVIADEPVSSLDVNIQAQIINLLMKLQDELGLSYLLIAHDLAVVRHISDRIAVMYMGKMVETATNAALFDQPLHPYTKLLISSAPIPDVAAERRRARISVKREMPSLLRPPSGCRFRTRCPIARPICENLSPPLKEHASGRRAACHFPGEF